MTHDTMLTGDTALALVGDGRTTTTAIFPKGSAVPLDGKVQNIAGVHVAAAIRPDDLGIACLMLTLKAGSDADDAACQVVWLRGQALMDLMARITECAMDAMAARRGTTRKQ